VAKSIATPWLPTAWPVRADTLHYSHVLRTDGGGALGFGHVNRCLSLASAIRAHGGAPEIVLGSADSNVLDRIAQAGHATRKLAAAKRYNATETLGGAARAIFDFSHARTHEASREAAVMLGQAHDDGARTLLIDSIGRDCLGALQRLSVDILAIPYAGAEEQDIISGPAIEARGTDFFVLDAGFVEYRSAVEPESHVQPSVLVTAGGSDPAGLTPLFLAALARIATPVDIRVVIGPGFSAELKSKIEQQTAELDHNTTLLAAPVSLTEEIFAADLALSASGLTKYELAYAGTPCILISIDLAHHRANRAFAELGSCLDAGLMSDVTPSQLAAQIETLLKDPEKQQDMATLGRAAVDGKGLQRMLELLDD